MLIDRDLMARIVPFLKRREYLAIVGPRQCGKTTFLEMLRDHLVKREKAAPDSVQGVTFEDRRLLMEFEADPVAFVRSYAPRGSGGAFTLMIDEFQYAQDGGQKLKLIYDTCRGLKIIVTGSSSLDLKAKVGKYMVGRLLHFTLYPFRFAEILRAGNKRLESVYEEYHAKVVRLLNGGKPFSVKSGPDPFADEFLKAYEEFCVWGGYPAVVLAPRGEERVKLLEDIYNNYILKDIKTTLEMATERSLYRLSEYLATQVGQIVVYQNLGQAAGLDHRKLTRHLNVLYETFVCREVRPFFVNRQKELSKNPKIYFLDAGFRNALMENMNVLGKRADAGALVENACLGQFLHLPGPPAKINFWRTKAGAEVDFVLTHGERKVPIEVKRTSSASPRATKSLQSFLDAFSPPHAVVLTKGFWGTGRRGKTRIFFIPMYYA